MLVGVEKSLGPVVRLDVPYIERLFIPDGKILCFGFFTTFGAMGIVYQSCEDKTQRAKII